MPEEIETSSGPKKGKNLVAAVLAWHFDLVFADDLAILIGLLSPLGDPLGKGVQATLSPVGAAVGGITSPIAEGASTVTSTATGALGIPDKGAEKEKAAKDKESIGGKAQTGQNPLGL